MASYSAIADVSETLVELLRDSVTERVVSIDRSAVALVSPADVTDESDVRLGLYLYDLGQNSSFPSAEKREVETDRRRDPPLALDAHYLLTAYPSASAEDPSTKALAQQRLLGLGMQVLHDNAVIDLPRQSDTDEQRQLTISLESGSRDRQQGLWTTFQETPYQPSVSYHVQPVLIGSRREETFSRVSDPQTDLSRKASSAQADRSETEYRR